MITAALARGWDFTRVLHRGVLGPGARRLVAGALAPALVASVVVATVALPASPAVAASASVPVASSALAWGDNRYGQLGDGTSTTITSPAEVTLPDSLTIAQVGSGASHTLAVATDGSLWAWGDNRSGQLGDGTLSFRDRPVPVTLPAERKATQMSGGRSHSLALATDGTLWAWGSNSFGQLGDGTTTDRDRPVQIFLPDERKAADISTGVSHSLALATDGTLWAWGNNSFGQLGDGSRTSSDRPVQVFLNDRTVADISTGSSHSLALATDGTLWAWGNNSSGQLGMGGSVNYMTPQLVTALPVPALEVAGGGSHTVAVATDGTLWAWGLNSSGQAASSGDGSSSSTPFPTQVSLPSGGRATHVAAGATHSLATAPDGTMWVWGDNRYGQLGDGTTTLRRVPAPLALPHGKASVQLSGGYYDTLAVASDGTAWSWGYDWAGQLGQGVGSRRTALPVTILGARTVAQVASGDHSLAVDGDGTVWAWGVNDAGQLGDGTTSNHATPVSVDVPDGRTVTEVASGPRHSLAVATDGSLWAWGDNSYGQLGGGLSIPRTTPVQVNLPPGKAVSQVATNLTHSLAVTTDGALWAWGSNVWGQLGNSSGSTSNPVQVDLGGRDAKQVAAGTSHSLAVTTDGSLWAWGDNAHGQLGIDSVSPSPYPVQVFLPDGRLAAKVAAGYYHSLAVATDGTLWAWGNNSSGQLGDGTTSTRLTPVQVTLPAGQAPVQISGGSVHSLAVASNGTLSTWGDSGHGQLGTGPTGSPVLVPMQVSTAAGGPLTGVVTADAGGSNTMAVARPSVVVAPGTVAFGERAVGSPSVLTVTVTDTGAVPVAAPTSTVTGPDAGDFSLTGTTCTVPLQPATATAAAGSCIFTVRFLTHERGDRLATLLVADDAVGNPQSVPLSGTGVDRRLTLTPLDLGFGAQKVGTAVTGDVVVTSQGADPLTVSAATVGDVASGFSLTGPALPLTLTQDQSAAFHVTFQPGATGAVTTTLTLTHDATGADSVTLSGTGVQPGMDLSPSAVTFGAQRVGTTSGYQSVTVTNTGTMDLTVSSVTLGGPNTGDFSQGGNTCTSAVPPAGTCRAEVAFSPQATGHRTGQLVVVSNSPNSPQSVALAGDGTNPVAEPDTSSIVFGEVISGASSTDRTVTVTNTGVGPLQLGTPTLTGADAGQFGLDAGTCAGATLADGSAGNAGTCTMTLRFTPSGTGSHGAAVRIPSNAANSPVYVQVTGVGVQPALTLNPATVAFGKVRVGTTATQTVTVTNTGTGTLRVTAMSVPSGPFGVLSPTLPVELAPGSSIALIVIFSPTSTGVQSTGLQVTANTGPGGVTAATTATLTGTGTEPVAVVSPSSLSFGATTVGTTSAALPVTVTNNGTASLTVDTPAFGGSYPGDYQVVSNGCTTAVPPGKSCDISVAFRPSVGGTRDATLTVSSDGAQQPTSVTLTGSGTTASTGGGGTGGSGADLQLSLSGPSSARSGAKVTFTVTVLNAGPEAASAISITDALGAGSFTFVKASSTTATCSGPPAGSSGTVSCTLSGLAAGASAKVTITAKVVAAPGSTISHTAAVSASTSDPVSSNNSRSVALLVK